MTDRIDQTGAILFCLGLFWATILSQTHGLLVAIAVIAVGSLGLAAIASSTDQPTTNTDT